MDRRSSGFGEEVGPVREVGRSAWREQGKAGEDDGVRAAEAKVRTVGVEKATIQNKAGLGKGERDADKGADNLLTMQHAGQLADQRTRTR